MIRHHARAAALLITAGALLLAGCAGVADRTRYYALSPTPAARGGVAPAAVSAGAAVGVGPVQMPRYLERLQIVTRNGNDELEISVDDRWAEPLENGIAQVLADNLGPELGSERITVFPWRGGVARVLDYQVVVMVLAFEGSSGREVTLDARWRLLGKQGQEIALKRSTINETITGAGYQQLVLGMNRTLARLAREIAAEIQSRSDTRAAGS